MIRMSERLSVDEIALCPLCDSAIMEWEEGVIVVAHGAKCLAHAICVIDEEDDNDEDDS